MPYIQPNILLTPTEKLIKLYDCSFIAIEGPNMKGKLNLEGMEIPYESFYVSQLILNQNAQDQPIIYGFLGEEITFLMVRARYMPLDPNWQLETKQYIEYYYDDEPTTIRHMSQLMILTGNSTNRIPQIFFNNPNSSYKVYLEILAANLAQTDLTSSQYTSYTATGSFSGLYWNSIISDIIAYSIPTSTGSTELKVLDINGNPLAIIPYNNIRTITKIDGNTLLIGLDTEEKIKLIFLSEYNCDQANSRINWALKSNRYRTLTKTSPALDTESPVFSWNDVLTGSTTGITSGTTTLYLLESGITYSAITIKEVFISGITDNVDGDISIYDTTVEMYALNDIVPVTAITNLGIYSIVFSIKDLANNLTTVQRYVAIYSDTDGIIETGWWNDDGIWIDIDVWID